jgi:hypothetical protein
MSLHVLDPDSGEYWCWTCQCPVRDCSCDEGDVEMDDRSAYEHLTDQPLDPGDTLADPERTVRLRLRVEDTDETRRERDADAALSDFGSGARWRRRGED